GRDPLQMIVRNHDPEVSRTVSPPHHPAAPQQKPFGRHPTKDEDRGRSTNFVAELSGRRHFKLALSPMESHLGRCGF
ncbi:hypothetical protein ACU6QR_00400, partial [Aeromonas veronii]|uniref:hypothetical protein n=1 Tax=Aeromonas veronii TaxID=654 RepID=UPI00406D480C